MVRVQGNGCLLPLISLGVNNYKVIAHAELWRGLMRRGRCRCRGHAGGLVGGALAAWLLGPNIMTGPDGQVADRPPLPILAGRPKSV